MLRTTIDLHNMHMELALKQPLLDDLESPVLQSSTSWSESQKAPGGGAENFDTFLVEELTEQCNVAGRMILVNLLQYLINIVSVIFVGRFGDAAFRTSSIATSLCGLTGYHVVNGLIIALELCASGRGAIEFPLVGVFLRRGSFIANLCCIPLSFIWWSMESILSTEGQDPVISDSTGEYARWLLPTLFAYTFLQPLVKFLQTQGALHAMTAISALTLLVQVPFCYFLVFHLGVGYRGAAIANIVCQWLNVVSLTVYINLSTCKPTLSTCFSRELFQEFRTFIHLAAPSTFLICVEYWIFELIALLSGLRPMQTLGTAALSISLNTGALIYVVPFGLSVAVSTRVAHKLGVNRPHAARAALKFTVPLALLEGFLMFVLLISIPNVWIYIYSMVPLLAAITILDWFDESLCGVARGHVWGYLGAYTSFGALYVTGIPAALMVAFIFHLDERGIWIGVVCGLLTQVVLLVGITLMLSSEKLFQFRDGVAKEGFHASREEDQSQLLYIHQSQKRGHESIGS